MKWHTLICFLLAMLVVFCGCGEKKQETVESDSTDVTEEAVSSEALENEWVEPIYDEFSLNDYVSLQLPSNWRSTEGSVIADMYSYHFYPFDSDDNCGLYINVIDNPEDSENLSTIEGYLSRYNSVSTTELNSSDISIINISDQDIYMGSYTRTADVDEPRSVTEYSFFVDNTLYELAVFSTDDIIYDSLLKVIDHSVSTLHISSEEEEIQGKIEQARIASNYINYYDYNYKVVVPDESLIGSYFCSIGIVYQPSNILKSFDFIEYEDGIYTTSLLYSEINETHIYGDLTEGNGIIMYGYFDEELEPVLFAAEMTDAPFSVEEYLSYERSTYAEYDYSSVARNPDEYKGKRIKMTGEVIQVQEDGSEVVMRINDKGTYNNTYYVTYRLKSGEGRILEDDYVTIYGLIKGLKTYVSIMGNTVSIPEINANEVIIN